MKADAVTGKTNVASVVLILNLRTLFVAKPKVLAAGRYIVFGTPIVEAVGWNLAAAAVLAIVTNPVDAMVSLLPLFVAKFNWLAAPKYIPLAGISEPVGIKADAVAVELNVALVPLNAPVSVPPDNGR